MPVTYVDGNVLSAGQLNSCNSTIYGDYNGNITNFNISASAAIALSKLGLNPGSEAFNQRTTGNRTWGSGLTTDTKPSVAMTSDGGLICGPGGSTNPDVGWRRSAANTMQLFLPAGGTPSLDLNGATISGLGTIAVTSGGTGLGTLTANNILIGNGTSPPTFLAPGAANGVINSNGTSWTRQNNLPVASGGLGTGTAPASGQIPIGNGGGTAYAPFTVSGDATLSNAGVLALKSTGPGVTSVTYASATIDAQGRVTALSSGTGPAYTAKFTSADQTITSSGSLTLAHGLSGTPSLIYFSLVNQSTEGGYSPGDIVFQANGGGSNQGVNFSSDGTNVYAYYGSLGTVFPIITKGGGADFNATNSKWKMRVYAAL